jgi:serine/threonine-protein kinase
MGEVYRADDLTLGQPVALKFLPREVAVNPAALERFRNEVRTARRVSHPNVCRVYDLGEVDGDYFLSMEYVDGEDLGSLLRRIGRLPEDKGLEIARRLCAGLAAAHEKGVLHRDLKPANIMLDSRGQVLLTDFGLAGLAGSFDAAEARNGTPAYMSPEQLAGREVTFKSDIYSLGLVLYEILTGKRAFEADTLAGMQRARTEGTITNPSTLVKDLDPRVERAILRCLEPDPANRPSSALAVAAALPGGDPLGEALAAGDTPSPEMVRAAGEGVGLNIRVAFAMMIACIAGLLLQAGLAQRLSALERMRLDYSPEILAQKARETIQRLGYPERPADESYQLAFDGEFLNYAESHDHPLDWTKILQSRPVPLLFAYRQSPYPMSARRIDNDMLTPGVVTSSDPPVEMSGMVSVVLDTEGRLTRFIVVPPQVEERTDSSPPDWKPFFAAAELDPAQFQPAEPRWTALAASDLRQAWTGVWPGSNRPLRVEAASLRGKPVVFLLMSPWQAPSRMPPRGGNIQLQAGALIDMGLGIALVAVAIFLARRNLRHGRSDRRSAFRLAAFIFFAHIAVWIFREHFTLTVGTLGDVVMAVATAMFWGGVLWLIYIALEPYARRRWPHSLISWTTALSGRFRDPIVGRDVLIGIALATAALVGDRLTDVWGRARGQGFNFGDVSYLMGFRSAAAVLTERVPGEIRTALLFFLLLFVLRVMLRNQYLAAAVFAALLTSQVYFRNHGAAAVPQTVEGAILYSMIAIGLARFGLLPLIVAFYVLDVCEAVQFTANTSAWYFGVGASVLALFFAMTIWAFRTASGSQTLLKDEL